MCTREVGLEASSPREAAHQLVAVVSPHHARHVITANTTNVETDYSNGENTRNTEPLGEVQKSRVPQNYLTHPFEIFAFNTKLLDL